MDLSGSSKADEVRIGDKNYGDRFRSSPKEVKKKKKGKPKKLDLTRLDLGDLSKQHGDVFRRAEDVGVDRFFTFMDMGGCRNYVKGNQILEETITKEKASLQNLSDLNLEAIKLKCKDSVELNEKLSKENSIRAATSIDRPSTIKVDASRRSTPDLRFDLNPYNKWNHQFVTGKVLTRREADGGFGAANTKFLESTLDKARPAVERSDLPKTSAQEIGWFTKTYRPILPPFSETNSLEKSVDPNIGKKNFGYKGITTFSLNPNVNHPKRLTDISKYKDIYWSYYPPPIAKFHPKENR